uniref:SERTA domain-containing protein n=1 Tax=Monopterus albus TaxID=43700 RepID=A0A3Q3K394_MONAL
MFGKGAKRKLDEDEEGMEGKTLEVSLAGGGLGLGPECLSKVSYTLQRQTIFNISLMKLYSQRPLVEPSLERRVLINNMLRRIQDELKQEGSLRPLLLPPSPPPDDPMDEGFREAAPAFAVLSTASQSCLNHVDACPTPLEACLTPASLLEEDGGESAFCAPSPPTPPLSPPPVVPVPASSIDGFTSTLSDMELSLPTAITRTAAANTTTVTTSSPPGILLAEARCAELRSMDTLPVLPPGGLIDISSSPLSPGSSSSPSGFLSDLALDDVLFADIDTSMYDFDPCTTAGSMGLTAGGSLTKLSPVVTADDLLKSLASPYNGPTPQVSASQPFKIDLTELDHIMEVLVGS